MCNHSPNGLEPNATPPGFNQSKYATPPGSNQSKNAALPGSNQSKNGSQSKKFLLTTFKVPPLIQTIDKRRYKIRRDFKTVKDFNVYI